MSYVFDVDGTLTPSRKQIDPDFLSFMLDFSDKHNVYFVSYQTSYFFETIII